MVGILAKYRYNIDKKDKKTPHSPLVRGAMRGWGILLFGFVLLTSSLKKHTFYNLLINNILYLCVT